MLVHHLVRVFPYLCKGKRPPAGSGTATRRVAFRRLLRLSRRSKACKTPPGYVRFSASPLLPLFSPLRQFALSLAVRAVTRSHIPASHSYCSVSDRCPRLFWTTRAYLILMLCRYIVRATEKQAVFTGKQQRDGVAILAFIVAGLFGPAGDEDAGGAFAVENEAERRTAAASAFAAGFEADEDDNAARVDRNFRFNWAAYHDEWGDTPVDVAVTSMFAEYAVLYARIAGRTTTAVPSPMTMAEGLSIGEHAKNFVNKFVSPILGHIASVKVHKLLCHVAEAIQWHGNLQNCNTAANESEHKRDKPHYCRTSKKEHTFTRELVRHAHGAREILARHADADKAAAVAWQAELARRAAFEDADSLQRAAGAAASGSATGGTAAFVTAAGEDARTGAAASGAASRGAAARGAAASAVAPRRAVASGGAAREAAAGTAPTTGRSVTTRTLATAGEGAAAAARQASVQAGRAAAEADQRRKQKRRMYNVANVSVGTLSSRPDMANVGALLRMAAHRLVRVVSRTPIQAQFDCGTRAQQQLRAVNDYLGAPWYDAVLYHPGGDVERVCIGELRAIVRGPKGDAVILAAMEDVPAEPLCPFVARGCVRLKWLIADGASRITLRLVPVEHVRRLAFVIPDFADLSARRGADADIPTVHSPLQERLDMRFFLNVFFHWDV